MEILQKEPLVSVIIPAYKGKYLKKTIDSVLSQYYKNIELIIVNDKSPDNIKEIVRLFSDERIIYVENKKNIGGKDPVNNWNKCLSFVKGEYFSLICDDDLYEPDFIGEMVQLAMKNPDKSVFRCRVKIIDANDNIIDMYPSSPEFETAIDYLWSKVSGYRIQTISEFLLKTDTVRELGGYINTPKAWCADEMSICKFALSSGIIHTNKLLASFRMSGDNISSQRDKNIREKIIAENIYTSWIKSFISNEPQWLRESIIKHRNNRYINNSYGYLKNASLKDFIFLWKRRKTKDYYIPHKSFIKAILRHLI